MVLEEEFLAQSISAQSKTNVVETRVDLEDDNDEVQDTHIDTSAPSQRTRKRTSKVWDMFEKVVVNGESKARCFGCNALLSAAPSSGTSHLKKHAEKVYPKKHLNIGTGSGSRASSRSPALRCEQFDQEFSRKELVNMVVLHEYPLSIVDHVGFRRFVHSLNSAFKMISRNTLKNDILKLFQCEKHSLKDMLAQNLSRIAITTDMWTASNQKKGYMVVTSHFINQESIMQSRTLRRIYTEEEAEVELCKIRKKLDNLLVEYQSKGVLSGDGLGGFSKQSSKQSLTRTPEIGHDDEDEFARSKRTKKRKVSVRCELEHYLGDDPLPDDDCFDILNFWKTDLKYPTLRNIARDILGIPISIVASESAFSMGGRVISPHRSRLHAKTVEAMMCLQNWMAQDVKDAIESTYACGTILDDSDDEDGEEDEPMDIFDMDLDDDIEISNF